MRGTLSKHKNEHFDNYDQDHGMFLGQGTNLDVLQSIQIKPSNVKNVYPMVSENNRKVVNLDEEKFKDADLVVVINAESKYEHDMFYKDPIKLSKFIDENKPGNPVINKARGTDTKFVLIVQDKEMLKYIPERENMQTVVHSDSNYVNVKRLFPEQKLVWAGACT